MTATMAATIATRTLSGVTNSDVVSLTGGTRHSRQDVGKWQDSNGHRTESDWRQRRQLRAGLDLPQTRPISQGHLDRQCTGVNKIYDGTTNADGDRSRQPLRATVLTTSYTSASFADKKSATARRSA